MKLTTFALTLAAFTGLAASAAAQMPGSNLPDTQTVEFGRAKPILDAWRDGKGWTFATTCMDPYGKRFVRYRVVVGVEGSLTVGGKTQVLLRLSPETAWIPVDSFKLPTLGGAASALLREVNAEIARQRNAVTMVEAGALAGTLPALVKTIEPTVGRPGVIPPRVEK